MGTHIKNLREERGLTIEDISIKTGIRKEYLRKIEQGKAYGVLIDKHLLKIARVLHVTMYEFFSF